MPIVRSSRLYVCYYRLWCAVPWLLVVGGQMQGSRRHQQSYIPHPGSIACCPVPDLRQPATKASHTIGGNNTYNLELLMMGIEMPETRWAYYKCNKQFSGIYLVLLYANQLYLCGDIKAVYCMAVLVMGWQHRGKHVCCFVCYTPSESFEYSTTHESNTIQGYS
jgi:hypothetical protein